MHEFVATAAPLKQRSRACGHDRRRQARSSTSASTRSTVYFPLIVEEALMVEPTETETKESLDAFAAAMLQAAREAETDPGPPARSAPVTTPVRRLDEAPRRAAPRAPLVASAPPVRLVIPDHPALKPGDGPADT
ncbi:MAG: hypothetical protein KatS3mg014_1360 [Actinomycetota bacterium]|nr:MAG: hypothetical protein KatS3mg014_1360 [Actinomycetota bacterium]